MTNTFAATQVHDIKAKKAKTIIRFKERTCTVRLSKKLRKKYLLIKSIPSPSPYERELTARPDEGSIKSAQYPLAVSFPQMHFPLSMN